MKINFNILIFSLYSYIIYMNVYIYIYIYIYHIYIFRCYFAYTYIYIYITHLFILFYFHFHFILFCILLVSIANNLLVIVLLFLSSYVSIIWSYYFKYLPIWLCCIGSILASLRFTNIWNCNGFFVHQTFFTFTFLF